MEIQWWCAAQTATWTWEWRAYPGVWLFMLLLIGTFVALLRHVRRMGVGPALRPRRTALGWIGLVVVWIALDWPVGTLGGGYLASLHGVQFLLLASLAPPLLLLGVPGEAVRDLAFEGRAGRLLRRITHPMITLLTFSVIVIATHLPAVSDPLMASQLGAMVIDLAWLGGGLLYWWPIAGPAVPRPGFVPLVRMLYLFASTVLMTGPGAFITFAELPLFATYELAPRIGTITALGDQRLMGLMMKVGGGIITWTAISITFYRWQRDEERLLQRDIARVPPFTGGAAGSERRAT